MKAVLTVMGIDKTGIIAKTSSLLYENDINILDINQTIIDVSSTKLDFGELSDKLAGLGKELGVEIRIQHEDIFNSMHRI